MHREAGQLCDFEDVDLGPHQEGGGCFYGLRVGKATWRPGNRLPGCLGWRGRFDVGNLKDIKMVICCFLKRESNQFKGRWW